MAVAGIRATLMASVPNPGPANLSNLIEEALRKARDSHLNRVKWSAVYIVSIIRRTAIQLQLEAMNGNSHEGKDKLLVTDSTHSGYTLAAYISRFGFNPRNGTFQAFETHYPPEIGDIIIQDRVATNITDVVKFTDIPTLFAPQQTFRNTHGDIVTEVNCGFVKTLGGNLGAASQGSVRFRLYPTEKENRKSVVKENQSYSTELNNGTLPDIPQPSNAVGPLSSIAPAGYSRY